MSELTVIITMAGLGTRFCSSGYDCPKYMISVRGKTLFEWSMDSLIGCNEHVSRYIFVVRREDDSRNFILEKCRGYGLRDVRIVALDAPTDGQATTCMCALAECDPRSPILVYNIDTYVEPGELKYTDMVGEGHIPCFHAPGDHWSFVKTDSAGNAVEVREKSRISDNCTLGAYYFSSAALFRSLYNSYYADDSLIEKKEKYIAPIYNLMIKRGLRVTISLVDESKVHVLGTPEELEAFRA